MSIISFLEKNGKPKKEKFAKFLNLDNNQKHVLLKALGFNVDRDGFIRKNQEIVKCKYTDEAVKFEEVAILPGSTIIIKSSPIAISQYIDEYLENE